MNDAKDKHVTIDELSEEFLARLKAGEQPSVDQYRRDYPELADEIDDVFPAMQALEQLRTEEDAGRQMAELDGIAKGGATQRFGDYRLVRELGRGGMGVVYEAVQESLDRRVAVKVLAADFTASPTDRLRFQREAEAAGRLYHTNIVPVFGVGTHGQLHYYVMQYIDGVGLDVVLDGLARIHGKTSGQEEDVPSRAVEAATALTEGYWRNLADIGLQVAQALAHAHEHGIVHRDIKLSNLLLDREGRVWVTDFGLAKHEDAGSVTRTGGMVGTLRYMAPEQFQGRADARSDVHSLGLTLYEMITCRPAFPESGHGELVRLKTTTEPPAVRGISPKVPRDLATVVEKACALDPQHRYQTASELAADLRRFLEDRPINARRVMPIERLWRWSRCNPVIASLVGVAAILLIAVALVSAIGYVRTTRALGEATRQKGRAEANLDLALEAFKTIMEDVSRRGVPQSLAMDLDMQGAAAHHPPLTAADAGLLESLLGFFDRFAEENEADLEAETADAYRRIGDIHRRLGNPSEAKTAYRKALALHRLISAKTPDDVLNLLALARVWNASGALEQETGATPDARTAHQAALETLSDAARTGGSAELTLERARTLNLLGSVGTRDDNTSMMGAMGRRKRGRTSHGTEHSAGGRGPRRGGPSAEEMKECYAEALGLLDDLCRSDPSNADYRLELAHCQRNHVLLALKETDISEAQRLLEATIRSFKALARDFPDVPQYQYELADVLCLQRPGRRGTAPVHAERATEAVAIAKRLASAYPWMPNYQALLATALTRQASAQEDAGRLAEAEDCYREAVALYGSLTARRDSTQAYELGFAKALHGLGDALRNQGHLPEAREALTRALTLVESHGRSRHPAYRALLGRLENSLSQTRVKPAGEEEGL